MHNYFLFLPTYLIAMVSYMILAMVMGAKDDYTKQAAEDAEIQKELRKLVEEEEDGAEREAKYPKAQKIAAGCSYAVLAVLAVLTLLVFFGGSITVEMYKSYSFPVTLVYFALGGIATYLKYGLILYRSFLHCESIFQISHIPSL